MAKLKQKMKYDYSKLEGRIIEKFGSQQRFAKEVGTSERTVSKKLNNHVYFTQEDIEIWSKALEIEQNEIQYYFFAKVVQ